MTAEVGCGFVDLESATVVGFAYRKPVGGSSWKSSGRRSGKQPGDPGSTMPLVDDPDEVITCDPGCCGGCEQDLSGVHYCRWAARRGAAIYLARAAEAHLALGDLDATAGLSTRALRCHTTIVSARGDQTLTDLRTKLAHHAKTPDVREFLSSLAEIDHAASPRTSSVPI